MPKLRLDTIRYRGRLAVLGKNSAVRIMLEKSLAEQEHQQLPERNSVHLPISLDPAQCRRRDADSLRSLPET